MRLIDWLSRDVVAIVDDDGDSCQSHKLIQRLLALGELRVLEKIRPQPLVRLTLLFPALSAYCLQVLVKTRVMANMIGDTDED
nr:MAG TPA: hypothetical protein [Caudoviricetes sp.]